MTTSAADMLSQLSKDTCAHKHPAACAQSDMSESLKAILDIWVPVNVGTTEEGKKV